MMETSLNPLGRGALSRRKRRLERPPRLLEINPQKISFYAFSAILTFIYVFGFDLMPELLRNGLSSIMAACCVVTFSIGLADAERKSSALFIYLSLATMIAIALSTIIRYQPERGAIEFARNFSGIFLISWAVTQTFYSARLERILTYCGIFAVAMSLAMPVLNDPILRAGVYRMGSITSGAVSLHPSAYLCALVAMWVFAIGLFKRSLTLAIPTFCILSVIVYLYKAQAAWFVLAFPIVVAVISSVLNQHLNDAMTKIMPMAILATFISFFLILYATQSSWDITMGSGRIGTWIDRFGRIGGRDPMQLLFGMGPSSDNFYGSLSWVRKSTHSHNDFLSTTLELGLIGVLAFMVFLCAIVISVPAYLRALVAVTMIASFLSGGILFKPTVAPVMAFIIVHIRMMYHSAFIRNGGPPVRNLLRPRRPLLNPI